MEYYKKQICLTAEELTSGDSPLMAVPTLKSNVRRGNIQCVKRGGGEGSYALYAWASLPEKYKQRFVELHGDPEEMMKEAMMTERVKLDDGAQAFFEEYGYEGTDGEMKGLSVALIEEYTINASVLAVLLKQANERRRIRNTLSAGAAGTWEITLQNSERLRESYHHTLPTSMQRLRARIKAFEKEGYESLLSGKLGNRNTLVVTEEFRRLLIALKRSKNPVYTNAQLFAEANRRAVEFGWKPMKSLSNMVKWLESPAVMPLWYGAVHGEQAARELFTRKQRTFLPSRRDSLWYGDGTKLNLYYQDEQGKRRTLQVYEVIDAMSEVLLGFHISESENYEAQYHAYRMAVQFAGYLPYEIVHDNQGGHKRANKKGGNGEKGFLDRICHVHRTTMAYNGSSKTIESVFGRFQQQVLHKDWRFTGQNITATKASSRPNMEFIDANADKLYTREELVEAYAKAREEWNESLVLDMDTGEMVRRIDLYRNSVNEEAKKVTVYDMVNLFWVWKEKPITMTSQGLTLTVDKKKYTYEVFSSPGVPDHEWRRRHTLERFKVAYDPYDMTSIRLYSISKDGGLHFERTAEPYLVIHRAIQDQTEGERAIIQRELDANKRTRIEMEVEGRLIAREHGTDAESHGLREAAPLGMTKAEREEIDRRTSRYSIPAQHSYLGRRTKVVSNETWADLKDGDIDETKITPIRIDMRKVAGKM